MSSKPVTRTPGQVEVAFLAGCMSAGRSLAAMGVVGAMLADHNHQQICDAYEARLAAGVEHPAELPSVPAGAMANFLELAASADDLPALALQVLDRWQRVQLDAGIDRLLGWLTEAKQAAAGMSRVSAHTAACNAMGALLDGLANLRMIAHPLPPLLTIPAHQASTVVFVNAFELRTLASALDLLATGLVEPPANAAAYRARADQMRELAAMVPAMVPPVVAQETRH